MLVDVKQSQTHEPSLWNSPFDIERAANKKGWTFSFRNTCIRFRLYLNIMRIEWTTEIEYNLAQNSLSIRYWSHSLMGNSQAKTLLHDLILQQGHPNHKYYTCICFGIFCLVLTSSWEVVSGCPFVAGTGWFLDVIGRWMVVVTFIYCEMKKLDSNS